MANEHFFPGDYFSPAPFLGASYAPAPRSGLQAAAAMAFGRPWADQQLPAADSSAHFDSALSSLVSSPACGGEDEVAIGDLIGRLGSICNGASANNSCYSTPLSSPPRGPFRGYGALESGGRLSRVSSSKSLGGNNTSAAAAAAETDTSPKTAGHVAMPDLPATTKGAARKRKAAAAKGKAKAEASSLPATVAINASPPKRPRVADGENEVAAVEEDEEKAEPFKDYIHVRARRGQATDSHSLAERVRREKISERMKLLQSLVPGCTKITGKALMLDEIINYVQSLQRQVEFLSMKLSTMNPELDFEGHQIPSKDMNQMAMPAYPSDDRSAAFSYTGSPADPFAIPAGQHQGQELQGSFSWEHQDLQSMVQMAGASSQDPHGFYGQAATVNHMKVEP